MHVGQTLALAVTSGSIYALLALGVVLVHRGSRVLNFALAEIGTMALFITYELDTRVGLPYFLSALLAVAAATGLGVAFEALVVRRLHDAPRVTVSVATIGLLLLILSVELTIYGGTQAQVAAPISGRFATIDGYVVTNTQALAVGTAIALGLGLTQVLRRTDFGLAVLASADDPQAVRLVGIPLGKVTAFTWGAGGAIAAVASLLFQPSIGVFGPGIITSRIFVFALAAALVGGLDSLQGAFVGGFAIALVQSIAQQVHIDGFSGLDTDVVVAVILTVLLTRPEGLLGKVSR